MKNFIRIWAALAVVIIAILGVLVVFEAMSVEASLDIGIKALGALFVVALAGLVISLMSKPTNDQETPPKL